jgi:hypothetical protein
MNPAVLLLPLAIAGPSIMLPAAFHDAAAGVGAPVALGAEAWYSSPQLCLIPQLCLPISSPLAATYPAGTLHIAAAAGNESARTYLSLRRLPKGTTVTTGILRLPLDTSPLDGSLAPDLAKIKACTTSLPIRAVEGSTAKPPATDCTDAPTSRIIGTPASELDIDLGPIAHRLSTPGAGLALLPVLSVGVTWDVTVSSDRRPKSSTTTPVLILTTTSNSSGSTPSAPSSPPTPTHSRGTDPGTVAIPSGPVDIGPELTEPPPATVSPPQIAASVPVAYRRLAPHGFDYPVVFLVPLLILAALLGFGRQLTRPLRKPADR